MAAVVDVLMRLSGSTRTPRLNVALAGLMAFVAGVLNSVGFVAVAVYTSHMTGITAGIADSLAEGKLRFVGIGALAIASFLLGAMACAWIFNWGRRRDLHGKFANVLAPRRCSSCCSGCSQIAWCGPIETWSSSPSSA
ncbi:DUF1275 family protein [Yimella sp. cx-51]|uniref:DUF1275 family protein n=1 Tax=Yimella sp. cx-51 TaxID=2770551 RepID=UPI002105F43F|nr:YoaK family protein [Yimella sp. cx-51]